VPPINSRPDGPSGEHAPAGVAAAAENDGSPLFIVTSPRPQSGKTFLARLLVDYLRLDHADPPGLRYQSAGGCVARVSSTSRQTADLGAITDQMSLFDRLVTDDGIAKLIDLGYGSFERFFDIADQIGLFGERENRCLETVVLFAADPHPTSANSYAQFRRRFQSALVVPVFNEAILQARNCAMTLRFTARLRCRCRFRCSRPCSWHSCNNRVLLSSTFTMPRPGEFPRRLRLS
jgi:hypothetical protein